MPPVLGAVAALAPGIIAGSGFTLFGSAFLGGLATTAAGAGLSYAANALIGKPDAGALRKNRPAGMEVALRAGDIVPRSFIAGTWATPGQLVYVRSWGDGDKTPNAYLVQVIVLSHLPVSELSKVYVDGAAVSWTPGAAQTGNGQAIAEYRKDGRDHLWIRFYDGSPKADGTPRDADSYLTSKFPSGAKAWASTNVGAGVAYAIVTSRWNPKLFNHAPELKFQLKGVKLYDITKDSTAGGLGTHRWSGAKPTVAEMATWEFTQNPAVILYNLMRGIFDTWNTVEANREWVYGLQTVSKAQLPFSSWAAAINECNVLITNKDASTERQFRTGGEISVGTEPGEEIEEFLKACNGRIADCGGVYKIKVGAAGAAVMSFTDNALMLSDEQSFTPFPSLNDTVNGIAATYVSPEEGWVEKAAPPRVNATYVTADGGRRSIADVVYRRVSEKRQVQRLSKAALLEERRFRRHVVVLAPDYWAAEPVDFVSWTSTRNGYTAKLFRVDAVSDRDNLDVGMVLTEVDPSDYNWTAASDEVTTTDGPLEIERPAAQAVAGFTASATSTTGDDGRALAVIRVNWTAADLDDVDKVLFEVRKNNTTTVVARASSLAPEAGTFDISEGINGATAYEVRAVFKDVDGRRDFTWSSWIDVVTPDVKVPSAQLAASLLQLINSGGAAGQVITEKVLPAPTGFQTLYRITVYGTGPNPVASGLYLYVDSNGVPGVILDVTRMAVGSLTNKIIPFEIIGGLVKIKTAAIGDLNAGNIKAGSLDVARIAGGSLSEFVRGNPSTTSDFTQVKVETDPKAIVQLTANVLFKPPYQGTFGTSIGRRAQGTDLSTEKLVPNSEFYAVNTFNGTLTQALAGTISCFDQPGAGKWTYRLGFANKSGPPGYKATSIINAVVLKK